MSIYTAPNGINSPTNAHKLCCQDLNTSRLENCSFWHYTDDLMLREAHFLRKWYGQIYAPSHTTYTVWLGSCSAQDPRPSLVKSLGIIWFSEGQEIPPAVKHQLLTINQPLHADRFNTYEAFSCSEGNTSFASH